MSDDSFGWLVVGLVGAAVLLGLGGVLGTVSPQWEHEPVRVQHVCDYLGGERTDEVCIKDGRVLDTRPPSD